MLQKKLKLKYAEILQGNFKLSDLNLLLIFQVNCPGCFLYALPVAVELFENYKKMTSFKILGLSTAFEDFESNTLEHTKHLLKKRELIGETKKAMSVKGFERLPFRIPFDVAFDELKPKSKSNIDKEVESYCETLDGYKAASKEKKDFIRVEVDRYFANKLFDAYTFDKNNLAGTPSWVLFDKNLHIYHEAFGHQSYIFFDRMIKKLLEMGKG